MNGGDKVSSTAPPSSWFGHLGPAQAEATPVPEIPSDETRLLPARYPSTRDEESADADISDDSSQPWILGDRIAVGGMGEVWLATQVNLQRVVALKKLRPGDDQQLEDRLMLFRQEAVIMAQLDHPNIVPIYDWGTDENDNPIISMKLVRGTPWEQIIAEDLTDLGWRDYLIKHLSILRHVAQAVAFAHSRGICHRDLKPQQVMVGDFGQVYLMDWGLALCYDPDLLCGKGGKLPILMPTRATAVSPAGTLTYMAPEQMDLVPTRIGPATDVYLLGGMLYHLLTGEMPRRSGEYADMELEVRKGSYRPVQEMVRGREIPEELVSLLRRCLDPDPETRLPSAAEFIRLLDEFEAGSTRRREASRLLQEVTVRIRAGLKTYNACADALSLVQRAALLDPGNERLEELRIQAAAAFCSLALRNDDMLLARLQANQIVGSPEYAKLDQEVETRMAVKRRHASLVRYGTAALMLCVVTVVLTVLYYNVRLSQRSAEVHQANRRTNAALDRSLASQRELAVQLYRTNLKLAEKYLAQKQYTRAQEALLDSVGDQADVEWDILFSRAVPWLSSVRLPIPSSRIVLADGGEHLLFASDNQAGLMDLATQRELTRFPPEESRLLELLQEGDSAWAVTSAGTIRRHSLTPPYASESVAELNRELRAAARLPSGRFLLSTASGSLLCYSPPEAQEVWETRLNSVVTALSVSPDGQRFAAATEDYTVLMGTVEDGSLAPPLRSHTQRVLSAEFDPANRWLLTSAADNSAVVWLPGDPMVPQRIEIGQEMSVRAEIFRARWLDARHFVTASRDNRVLIWDAVGGQLVNEFTETGPTLTDVSARYGGPLLAVLHDSSRVVLWDVRTRSGTQRLAAHQGHAKTRGVAGDPPAVITSSHDNTVRIWNARNGRPIATFAEPVNSYSYSEARLSPDGSQAVMVHGARQVTLREVSTGTIRDRFETDRNVDDLAMSPDGSRIAAVGVAGLVVLRDVAAGVTIPVTAPDANGMAASFSPDGKVLAVSFQDNTVRLYDSATGAERQVLRGLDSWAETVEFDARGNRLVGAGFDSTIAVWNLRDGSLDRRLRGHSGWASGATFSPSGYRVISTDTAGTLCVWDATTGVELSRIDNIGRTLNSVAIDRSGSYLALGLELDPLEVWEVATFRSLGLSRSEWEARRFRDWLLDSQEPAPAAPLVASATAKQPHLSDPGLFAPWVQEPLRTFQNGPQAATASRPMRILCLTPPLPPGEGMFITGNRPEVGNWTPNSAPMTLLGSNEHGQVWEYTTTFRFMVFKFTAGRPGQREGARYEWDPAEHRNIDSTSSLYLDRLGQAIYLGEFGRMPWAAE